MSFVSMAMQVQFNNLGAGDVAPGYWLSADGAQAIVGTKRADGSYVAYLSERTEGSNGLMIWKPAQQMVR